MQTSWNLTHIFLNKEEWFDAKEKLKERIKKYEIHVNQLTIKNFKEILEEKIQIDEQIEKEAFEMANQKVAEAKSEKQKALEQKQESQEDLISQLAALIIEQNKTIVGEDVAANAIEKVQEEAQKRRGRPKKSENLNEGGTKENEQEEKLKRRRTTKTA